MHTRHSIDREAVRDIIMDMREGLGDEGCGNYACPVHGDGHPLNSLVNKHCVGKG